MKKIIFPLVAVLILTAAFFFGGNAPGTKGTGKEVPEVKEKIAAEEDVKTEERISPITEKEIEPEVKKEKVTEKVEEEPEELPVKDGEIKKEPTCTLVIKCDTILDNMDWLSEDKHELVPENGVIYEEKEVIFNEGESVFNLLARETKKNGIHLEFVNVPIYKSAYIEGIGNIYEFDCGELSGWVYNVNGFFPNYGCSRYILKDGDKVEWLYTCDLGDDVGGYNFLDQGE